MFAVTRRTIIRNKTLIGRRLASTVTAVPKPPLPEMYQTYSFQESFLSDPSTYPLIIVMAAATSFIIGMSANALANYKDLRIRPKYKHQLLQDWGTEHRTFVTDVITREPIAFHAQAFKDIRYEGLGYDHEQWKKTKDDYHNREP